MQGFLSSGTLGFHYTKNSDITELYKEGYIDIPQGVIKIWVDNGYGRMVSRRQGSHNPRVPSLPEASDAKPHGFYYHITFHVLQVSNHLVMFPNPPEFIVDELSRAFGEGAGSYLLVSSGNIRPHVLFLDLVQKIWTKGTVIAEEHLDDFCSRYFSSMPVRVKECHRDYLANTIK